MLKKTEKSPIYQFEINFGDGFVRVIHGDSLEPYKDLLTVLKGNKSDGYGIVYAVPIERVREIISRKYNGQNAAH